MKQPSIKAYRGLWAALNVAAATPAGGDFTEERLDDVAAAIEWLKAEVSRMDERASRRRKPD